MGLCLYIFTLGDYFRVMGVTFVFVLFGNLYFTKKSQKVNPSHSFRKKIQCPWMPIVISLKQFHFRNKISKGCSTSFYQKSNGSYACGIYLSGNVTFHDAEIRCVRLGARLPEVRSKAENQDILERVVSFFRFQLS